MITSFTAILFVIGDFADEVTLAVAVQTLPKITAACIVELCATLNRIALDEDCITEPRKTCPKDRTKTIMCKEFMKRSLSSKTK